MKKNIKTIIGLIIAFIIGISTTVGAAAIFRSEDITYSSDKTDKTNVKDSLDELYDLTNNYVFYKPLADQVELGDYISMTPISTSYIIPARLTGSEQNQEINPSELNLWRVIKKNEDGTVDVVSEFVSSTSVTFIGKTGYLNYVGVLNQIAAQYTNPKYVKSTRHIGYNGQTEYITNTSKIDSETIPWDTVTVSMEDTPSHGNTYEELGGGDSLWESDLDLVRSAVGSVSALNSSGGICSSFLSGRQYHIPSVGVWRFYFYYVDGESAMGHWMLDLPWKANSEKAGERCVRPILTFKASNIIQSGDGKSAETAYAFE